MPKIVDHEQYRKELLSQCFDLFAEKGYASITMRQIAQEVGVSTGTLYHYFPSKEELFEQLIEEISQQDILRAAAEIETLETLEERVLALGNFLAENEDYFLKQWFLYVNLYQQQGLEETQLNRAVKLADQRYREAIAQFLGIDDPAIAIHVLCLIDGLVLGRAFDPERICWRQQAQLLAQLLSAYLEKLSSKRSR